MNRVFQGIGVLSISIIVLLTVVGIAARNETVTAQAQTEQPARRTITVSGTGRVSATPDEATINIGVQITAKTLEEATTQANDAMARVLAAIKAQGVDSKEIQTSIYSVNPLTTYREGQPPVVTGYQVMNVVTVKVKNMDNVGKVLDAGMGAGANYLGGVFFGVADPTKYQNDARTAAVQDATRVAQALATVAGVKLGNVISVSESAVNVPQPIPQGRVFAADAAAPGPVEGGSLEISTNVVMQFEMTE
jgi:uncharacterized protein YggE